MKQRIRILGGRVMQRWAMATFALLLILPSSPCRAADKVDTLTYAVYPYLPDSEYYQDLIEKRWRQIEPDIRLVRADWNCYDEAVPEGIDVIMYDSMMRNTLIEAGWIQPIEKGAVQDVENIYAFALDGFESDGRLYGIPVFLCGYFLIYDKDCGILAEADHITDLAGESALLVISSEDPGDREQFALAILADTLGEEKPAEGSGDTDEIMELIDRLAVEDHKKDYSKDVTLAYDRGIGSGYIGYSETMRFLDGRISETDIKTISFSDQDDLPRMYVDAAAITGEAEGERYEKALELINVMAEADILAEVSVREGAPQYLLLARPSAYDGLVDRFPLYTQLEKIAADENNRVILGP